MQTLGLVLIPEEQSVAERISSYARTLIPGLGPVHYMLGEQALPHVTLAHVRSSVDPVAVWADVGGAVDRSVDVSLVGLRFHPVPSDVALTNEEGWRIKVFLQVLSDPDLRRLLQQTLATDWCASGEVLSAGEKTFDPHFTLGSTQPGSGSVLPAPIDLPTDLVPRRIPMRLILGSMGKHGVLQDVLFGDS